MKWTVKWYDPGNQSKFHAIQFNSIQLIQSRQVASSHFVLPVSPPSNEDDVLMLGRHDSRGSSGLSLSLHVVIDYPCYCCLKAMFISLCCPRLGKLQ